MSNWRRQILRCNGRRCRKAHGCGHDGSAGSYGKRGELTMDGIGVAQMLQGVNYEKLLRPQNKQRGNQRDNEVPLSLLLHSCPNG